MRERVLAFYRAHDGQALYPSDVAEELRMDAWQVFQVTQELSAEGILR